VLVTVAQLPLVLGANIGTCITGLLAAAGQGAGARRVACALTLMRVVGAVMCLPFTGFLIALTASLTAKGEDWKAPATIASVVAGGNTLFNVILCLAFLPFTGRVAQVQDMQCGT